MDLWDKSLRVCLCGWISGGGSLGVDICGVSLGGSLGVDLWGWISGVGSLDGGSLEWISGGVSLGWISVDGCLGVDICGGSLRWISRISGVCSWEWVLGGEYLGVVSAMDLWGWISGCVLLGVDL